MMSCLKAKKSLKKKINPFNHNFPDYFSSLSIFFNFLSRLKNYSRERVFYQFHLFTLWAREVWHLGLDLRYVLFPVMEEAA
jgi:hypothetical protein